MSVTTVLVPADERESRALLAGTLAPEGVVSRAARLRRRAALVDAVREELHELLFPLWNHEAFRFPGLVEGLRRFVTGARPVAPDVVGYDPYVQVFGRTFPVQASTPPLVAKRLEELLRLEDDGAFREALVADLSSLDPRAGALLAGVADAPIEVVQALENEAICAREAVLSGRPADGLFGVARVAAWSRPVWRLDGVMVAEVLRGAGSGYEWGAAGLLFDDELARDPALAAAVAGIPGSLPSFRSTGAVFSGADVQAIAGSLRLRWRMMFASTVTEPAPAVAVRNLRLAAEAFAFAEGLGTGLIEAAGVEWHERIS